MDAATLSFVEQHYRLSADGDQFPRLTKGPGRCISCGRERLLVKNDSDNGTFCMTCKRLSCEYGGAGRRLTGCITITDHSGVRIFVGADKGQPYDAPLARMINVENPVINGIRAAMETEPPFVLTYHTKDTFGVESIKITFDRRVIHISGNPLSRMTSSPLLKVGVQDVFQFDGELVRQLLGVQRKKISWEEIIYYSDHHGRLTPTQTERRDFVLENYAGLDLPELNSAEHHMLEMLS